MHAQNMFKRGKKIRSAAADADKWGMLEYFGNRNARVAIVGWGSTIGPVREAVEQAEAEGMPVAVLYTKMIYPLPRMEIADFIRHRDVIIVPEMNYTGQFARMIQAEYWREVVSLRKYGGVPFATHEVYEEIKRVYAAVNATPRTRSIAKRSAPVKRVAAKAKKVMPKKKAARRK